MTRAIADFTQSLHAAPQRASRTPTTKEENMTRGTRRLTLPVASLLTLAFSAAPLAAQSDILLQLRSGVPAGDRFRIDSAGGFVALGHIGYGTIPASGEGSRMMWYPYKVAFRAGYADVQGQFDDANIGFYSWAGGALNRAAGIYSFAMGNQNTVEANAQCGMAMGSGNVVHGSGAKVGTCGLAFGLNNDVYDHAGVAIGKNSTSDGDVAVAIGYQSTADADYSMAFGYRASTNGHIGARVFGDASTTDSIEATANNEFAVRAAGGYRFRTNATLTTGCNLPAGSGVFSCSSSRFVKHDIADVDGEDVLARLAAVPVQRWKYNDEPGAVWHMGPMAQDFRAAFGLGTDDTTIGHIDITGVTLAAAKALDARTAELGAKTREIDTLRAEVATLRVQNAALQAAQAATERRVEALEATLSHSAAGASAERHPERE